VTGASPPQVGIRLYMDGDLPLLWRLNTPTMLAHLGGPETDEAVLRRHQRYVRSAANGPDRVFAIVLGVDREPVGFVGYWDRAWGGEQVYEAGWSVVPEHQGQGIATAATAAAVAMARREAAHATLHAFPSVDNAASNAVCRKLSFTLAGACDFEYPPGHVLRCNDWYVRLAE
jgi:RimJ/RimL family protein N-acetyltransferase